MDQKKLKDLMRYCPDSGNFYWLKSRSGNKGKVAGAVDVNGYRRIMFGSNRHGAKRYLAHRLVWLYVYGDWPDGQIDHKNGDRDDNRIGNLRLASASQNQWNCKTPKNNKSGYKGVYSDRGYWRAVIRKNGKPKYLGYFDTPELAHAAYCQAANEMHGEFANHG